jgi:predicted small integral membrane protein
MIFVSLLFFLQFDTVAREWRMKWSGDNDKASLAKVETTNGASLALSTLDSTNIHA